MWYLDKHNDDKGVERHAEEVHHSSTTLLRDVDGAKNACGVVRTQHTHMCMHDSKILHKNVP